MGRHLLTRSFLAFALTSATVWPAGAADGKPALTLVHQGAAPLSVTQGKASASLAVTGDGIEGQRLSLLSVSVVHKGTNRAVRLTGGEVTYLPPAAPGGFGWLQVQIPLSLLPDDSRFGTYEMVVRAAADGRPVAPVTVTLTYPESVIAQPDRVVLRIEDSILGRTVAPASVWLRVTDGPPPDGVTIRQAGAALLGNEPIGGRLVFGAVSGLDNHQATPVPVSEDDTARFPRGESTGQALVSGPDGKPVTVPFVVKVKAASWCIFAFALLGIFLGWLTRIQFVNWIGKKEVLVGLEELRQKIEAETVLREDAAFSEEIAPVAGKLGETAERMESAPPEAKKMFDDIQARLDAAVAASEARRKELISQAHALRTLVERNWICPPEVYKVLRTARVESAELAELLSRRKLDHARVLSAMLGEHLNSSLGEWIMKWNDGTGYLRGYAALEPRLPADVAPAVKTHLAALRSAKAEPANESPDELLKGLEAIHHVSLHARALRANLLDGLARAVEDCQAELGQAAQLDSFARRLREARAIAPLANLPASLEPLAVLAADALQACIDAILRIAGTANPDVKGHLDKGEYQLAARLARTPPPPRSTADAAPQPAAPPQGNTGTAQGTVIQIEAPGRVLIPAPPSDYVPGAPIRINVPRTRLEIAQAQGIRDAVAALVLATLAYPVFSPTFIGTINDILGVFAWGFTLDVGFSGLVQQLNDRLVKKQGAS